MCLNFIHNNNTTRTNTPNGIAYKVVRLTDDPRIFLPFYSYFSIYGNGCGFNKNHEYHKIKVKYRLDKWYTVKHLHMAMVHASKTYLAGVHLYKHLRTAEVVLVNRPRNGRNILGSYDLSKHAIVQFKWSQYIAEDLETIVAARVKPIGIIRTNL